MHGFEATGQYQAGPWTLGVGASLTDARVNAGGAAAPLEGLRPAQTPNLITSARLTWERDDRTFAIEVRHVGSQFEDDLNSRKLRPATTVDAFAAWPLSRSIQLTARGQNLLNETIEASRNDDGSIERATPFVIWLGARLDL